MRILKLTKSESGRLGGKKFAENAKIKRNHKIFEYNKNPSLCKYCQSSLQYDNRGLKFCSNSCSNSYNNSQRNQKYHKPCPNCDTIIKYKNKKFCNVNCHKEFQYKTQTVPKILAGLCSERGTLKKYLLKITGWICSSCQLSSWLNSKIPLELDHIDGNAGNNFPSNLRLLCPNCHAQTPTAKGKNKGNGRLSRGLPRH